MKKTIFLILSLITFIVQGANLVYVRSTKAVIYSDPKLLSAIGYVKRGQRLWVGETKRRRGTVLPVAVNGQVGWIRVLDLNIQDLEIGNNKKSGLEHNVLVNEDGGLYYDPMNKNNYLEFRLGSFSPTLGGTNEVADDEVSLLNEPTTGLNLNIMFQHRFPLRKLNWAFGFGIMSSSGENFSLRSLNLIGHLLYTPFRWNFLELDAFVGPIIGGDFKVESADFGSYQGTMYGVDLGAQLRLLPLWKLHFSLGFQIQSMRFVNLDKIENLTNDNIDSLEAVTNASITLSLNYSL